MPGRGAVPHLNGAGAGVYNWVLAWRFVLKKCPSCGTENPDEARYCVKCGALLSVPQETTGPYSGEVISETPPPEKKSKWWIWLIIAIVVVLLIALGICCIVGGGCTMLGLMNQ